MSKDTSTALLNFRACVDDAPAGTYEDAKALGKTIDATCASLIQDIRALGLKADTCDLIFAVEAAIYNYVAHSNPESGLFPTAEGFGSAMSTPARERVIAGAECDRDSLAKVG
ncbi:hypothetical protein PsaNZ64_00380 [Pseudomonas syringae pv. actinidiae]|uniref:hypothetical protein n=1 Tax=Pseudomonas syringae group TaxID=136849 RepID=UPI0006B8E5CF|nr:MULTISPECIES: hypothetical protein [Pseudomonas syringae group]KPB36953.1 Uncharacterized protein AC516_4014 [Pseudomonas amygdali pv. sesami]OKS78772.1 hypothetical protein PsaNZ64_00380 [Pseudomonas syringae pv. actinidiae]